MSDAVNGLMIDFLAWVASRPRTYSDVMEAWRTTCPRLTVWEDANDGGLVIVEGGRTSSRSRVTLTPRGRALLEGAADAT